MHVVAPPTLLEFARQHSDAATVLLIWLRTAKAADWASLENVRQFYPTTDPVKVASGRIVYVFNIKGNSYRLVTAIHFNRRRIFILRFMTHAQYSKDFWKSQL